MDVATYNFFQFQISLTYPHPYHLYDLAAKKIPKGKIVNEKIREEIYINLSHFVAVLAKEKVSLYPLLFTSAKPITERHQFFYLFFYFFCAY